MSNDIDLQQLRLDYLIFPHIQVWQHPQHFRMNTDTGLLAKFLQVRKGDKVLEIGTNNGALLVWMDQFEPASLDGVEILEEPSALAAYNCQHFVRHPWRILNEDVRLLQEDGYDLIVSNPPFFTLAESGNVENLTLRQKGRVEVSLTLEELIQNAKRLLKSNGRLAIVHRPDRLMELLLLFKQYGFCLSRFQIAYDRRDECPRAILAEGVKDRCIRPKILPPAWIGDPGA